MSNNTDADVSETTYNPSLTIRINQELADKISGAETATKLNRSAMLRLAIDRGLDRLLEQLEVNVTETTNTAAEP